MLNNPVGSGGVPGKYDWSVKTGLELYNLETDPSETTNVVDDHPKVMETMHRLAARIRADLGDISTEVEGANNREAGKVAP